MRPHLSNGLKQAIGLSLIGTALVAAPTSPAQAAPKDPPLVQQMRAEASGNVAATTSPATDRLGFIRTTDDLLPSMKVTRNAAGAAEKATAYAAKYGRAFGGSSIELSAGTTTASPSGYTVDFAQTYDGLPVFGGKLRAHVDKQGDLTSIGGFVAPGIKVATTPKVSESAAVAKVKRLVKAAPSGGRNAPQVRGDLSVSKADLSIYRMGAIQGVEGRNLLAWVIEVTDGKQVRETVVLDAATGKPVNRYSMIAHDLDRELHEESITDTPVWKEGDAFPAGLDVDQESEVRGTGEAYWFFKNSFGRDSWDGQGGKMITVNNDPTIDCPNANWNGVSTNYCSGVSSDDTVAHEWGHAYTEKTSGLLYQWQAGAMNEAFSDVWGETVDMLNDRQNDTPDGVRAVGDCSKYSIGIAISITAPEDIAGECVAVKASGGPDFPDPAIEVPVVVGLDGEDLANDDLPTDGCDPFTNAADIAGNWVYVDENLTTGCGEDDQTAYYELLNTHAVDADAMGLIVGGDPAYEPWDMPGATFAIPAAQIDGDSGAAIKSVNGPVTLSVGPAQSDEPVIDSYRWLSGEGDPAFGGAIRDMWNPNCYGDPAKVSDEEYYCDTADSGGVHTNSGVVNHTFALLVDGGTYNGQTVAPIGLDKAAHLFWNAQTQYLTSVSGFAELADGLEASCNDLKGNATLNKLAVGVGASGGAEVTPSAMPAITAADCAAVTAVVAATELRVEPVQCNFQLMFKKGRIGCGEGTVTKDLWTEGFDGGLPAGWTQDVEYADFGADGSGGAHFDAKVVDTLPVVTTGGTAHKGSANVLYFNDKGDAGNYGSCQLDADDYSSRVGITTKPMTVPEGDLPRLSFDHYVASEVGWDGGNVKVKVNDAPDFTLVPAQAWLNNGPGADLETFDAGSTNPMAGETAFTGTDGGEPTGSWGNSTIDLSAFSQPGDTVTFRFDFGMDGCNGIDGWYIDNLKLSVCAAPPVVTPPAVQPSNAIVYPAAKANKRVVKIRVLGPTPAGPVTVSIKGKTYTGTVVNGMLKVKAKKQLKKLSKKGKRKVKATVSYGGDASVAPFSGRVVIKIKK